MIPLHSFGSSALFIPSATRVAAGLFSSLEPPEPNIWAWLSAARRAAFSIRSWSTSARHSSHRRFASSAEASAASSSCERDSNAFTCLRVERENHQPREKKGSLRGEGQVINVLISTFTERTLRFAILFGTFTLTKRAGCSRRCCSSAIRRLCLRTVLNGIRGRRGQRMRWWETRWIISRRILVAGRGNDVTR